MDKSVIRQRLAFWESAYTKLQAAYLALIDGGAKSYSIDDRSLTRFDLPEIKAEMNDAEQKIAELQSTLNGGAPRRAFAVLPRNW